jgi:hypothetical protein
MNQQCLDSQRFSLSQKAFHLINLLSWAAKKVYSIELQGFRIFLAKEQTLLLSTSAFEYNHQFVEPFIVGNQSKHIPDDEVLDDLSSFLSLFDDAEQVEINYRNMPAYFFISLQFDNSYLKDICLRVNANILQIFFFSSTRFLFTYKRTLSALFDFTVYINNEPFSCNSAFACCLSQEIFDLKCKLYDTRSSF